MSKKRSKHRAKQQSTIITDTGPSPFSIVQDIDDRFNDHLDAEKLAASAMVDFLRLMRSEDQIHTSTLAGENDRALAFERINQSFEKAIALADCDDTDYASMEAEAKKKLLAAFPNSEKMLRLLNHMIQLWDRCCEVLQRMPPHQQYKVGQFLQQVNADLKKLSVDYKQDTAIADKRRNEVITTAHAQLSEWGEEFSSAFGEYFDLLATNEGFCVGIFLDRMNSLDQIRHSSAMIRLMYAQVLAAQGGSQNKADAKTHLRCSLADSMVADLFLNSFIPPATATNIFVN